MCHILAPLGYTHSARLAVAHSETLTRSVIVSLAPLGYNSRMFTAVVFGAFGLIVGSFLNVLIIRWGTRSLAGRSACMSCGRTIPWHDLVPVLSWILLGGKCRLCGSPISLQYILVEAGTGLLFFIIGLAPLPLYAHLFALPIAAILLAIAVYDLKHTLIPDAWVYVFAAFSLVVSLTAASSDMLYGVLTILLAGPVVAAPLFAFWFFSKGAWMGFGDVKLALGMGWLLGAGDGMFALFFAFMLGALVSVPLLFFSSPVWVRIQRAITPNRSSQRFMFGFTMKSEIPFGPFLVAATLIVWISSMHGFAPMNVII